MPEWQDWIRGLSLVLFYYYGKWMQRRETRKAKFSKDQTLYRWVCDSCGFKIEMDDTEKLMQLAGYHQGSQHHLRSFDA